MSERARHAAAARRRMCAGKVRYGGETQAIAAALRCSRDFGPCRVYRCPVCGGRHITTKVEVPA